MMFGVVCCLVLCVVCGLFCDGSCFLFRCCALFGVKCLSFACPVVCRVLLVV